MRDESARCCRAAHELRILWGMQVTPRNAVSLTEQDAAAFGGLYGPPPAPHVSHAAFSADGATLATLDVRADAGAAGSAAPVLQFWDARSGGGGGGGFVLNTQIAEPHRCAVFPRNDCPGQRPCCRPGAHTSRGAVLPQVHRLQELHKCAICVL